LITSETSNGLTSNILKLIFVCDDSICKQYKEYEEAKNHLMDETISRNKRQIDLESKFGRPIPNPNRQNPYELDERQKKQIMSVIKYIKAKAAFVHKLIKEHKEQEQRKKEEERKAQEMRISRTGDRDSRSDRGGYGGLGRAADRPGNTPGSAGERLGRTAR
jgi:hypothetical protein